jgi:hypothetical protein
MLVGGVLAVALFLFVDLSMLAFVIVGVLLALYELALWRLAPAPGSSDAGEAVA